MAVTHIKSNIVADFTGTVTVFDNAGASQTMAATDLVRPSDWNSAHGHLITLGGNTAGASTVSGTNIVYAGGNNITLSGVQGANVATITIAGGGGAGDGVNILAAGTQTANTTGTVAFLDSNGIAWGMSNSSQITASYTQSTHSHSTAPGALAAGTQTATSGTIVFADSNGVAFGLSGSTQITASYTQSTHSHSTAPGALAAGTQTATSGTIVFADSNGVAFGLSGSTQITASYSQSTHSHSTGPGAIAAGTQTATSGTIVFVDSNGLAFGMSGSTQITGSYSQSTHGHSLSMFAVSNTTQSSSGTQNVANVSFAGAGAVSVGVTNGSVVVSAPNTVAQTNQTAGIYVTAQSTGQSSSSTYDARTLSMVGDGIVSIGWSNGTLRVSATQSNQAMSAAGGSSAFQTLGFSDNAYASWTNTNGSVALTEMRGSFFAVSNTTQSSSGTQNLDAISFAGAGGVSVGVSNGSVVISAAAVAGGTTNQTGPNIGVSNLGNTSGSTGTVSTGNVVFAGLHGITLSQSTAGAGSNATITISGMQRTLSYFPYDPPVHATSSCNSGTTGATGGSSQTTASLFVAPLRLENAHEWTNIGALISYGTAAGTGSVSAAHMMGIYTRTGNSISLLSSFVHQIFYSQNNVTAVSAHMFWGTASSTNSTAFNGNSSASMTGARLALFGTSNPGSFSSGDYFVVHGYTHRTSGASVGAPNSAAYVNRQSLSVIQPMGQAAGAGFTNAWRDYMGALSVTSNGTTTGYVVLPDTIATTDFSGQTASASARWFQPMLFR